MLVAIVESSMLGYYIDTGASLSEPHIDKKHVRNVHIMFGTYITSRVPL